MYLMNNTKATIQMAKFLDTLLETGYVEEPQVDLNGEEEYRVLMAYTKGYIEGKKDGNEKPF
jgi:hypothetical protein